MNDQGPSVGEALTPRQRIDAGFAAWGRFVVRQRRLVLMLATLATVALGSLIPELRFDNSTESFLHPDDPARTAYEEFRAQFDRDDRIVVGLLVDEVFTFESLEAIRLLHREIEAAVPHLEQVDSLVDARATYGRGDELVVEDLLETWPDSQAALASLRERALANPLYVNAFVSADAKVATVVLKPDTYTNLVDDGGLVGDGFDDEPAGDAPAYLSEAEEIELVRALHQVLERQRAQGHELLAVGGPLMNTTLNARMMADTNLFVVVTTLVMAAILGLLFRRASGVILPMIVVLSSLVATLGIMVLIDVPMSVVIQILPAFLLAVGVCDSVHLLVIVYQRMSQGEAKHDAIPYALSHSGFAVFMTSLTTSGGLLSFVSAELAPVANLGIVAPIGVMLAFVSSVTLLPALVAVAPIKASSRAERHAGGRVSERILVAVGDFVTARPVGVLLTAAAVLTAGGLGVSQLRFAQDAIGWFPKDDPLRVASERLNEALEGVASLEVMVATGRENGLQDPVVMQGISDAMDAITDYRAAGIGVGGSVSIVNVVKETHRALNENRESHYAIPETRELLAQELLLFENSGADDLEQLTTPQLDEARVTVRLPWVDAIAYPEFIEGLVAIFERHLRPHADIRVTGNAELFSRTFRAVILSVARSYVIALLVIT